MLNKIIYTILGFGLAFVFFPHISKDITRYPVVSGVAISKDSGIQKLATPELALALTSPALSAKSALAFDADSGSILYSKNLDQELPIASLTKMMTALVVMKQTDLNSIVTIEKNDQDVVGISIGLISGEQLTVRDLLKAMLIPSSNDAALALAHFISGSPDQFAVLMNDQAKQLSLTATYFSNPVGWDTDENHSSALDLMKITQEFLNHKELTEIVKTKQATIISIDGKHTHDLLTTNKLLLNDSEVMGIKTGFTSKALGNLVIMAEHNNRRIVTIVLGSESREVDSQKLLDWVLEAYRW